MNSTKTTIDAMRDSRVRSACPQVGRVLLAGTWGAIKGSSVSKGSTVSAATLVDVRVSGDAYVPAFGFGGFDDTVIATATDVVFQPFGEPPV
jgi:hypothetical protein